MSYPLFQRLQDVAYRVTKNFYGTNVIWESGSGIIRAKALFNNPSTETRFSMVGGRGLNHVGYNNAEIEDAHIEYDNGLPGMYELVYTQDENQFLIIEGVRYVASKVNSKFDGKTYFVYLKVSENQEDIPE